MYEYETISGPREFLVISPPLPQLVIPKAVPVQGLGKASMSGLYRFAARAVVNRRFRPLAKCPRDHIVKHTRSIL